MIEPTRPGKSRWARVLALFDGGDVVFLGGLVLACYGRLNVVYRGGVGGGRRGHDDDRLSAYARGIPN